MNFYHLTDTLSRKWCDLKQHAITQVAADERRLVMFVAFVCLFFTFTNFVPFSALMILLVFLVPYLLIKRLYFYGSLSSAFVFSSLMLLYFLGDILVYDSGGLLQFDFYRRDGNVFITYAPLVILSLVHLRFDINRLIGRFLLFFTALNIVLMCLWKVDVKFSENIDYQVMFVTHNAAGGFVAMCTALCLGYYLVRKRNIWLVIFLVNFFSLVLTHSRGSILGLLGAIFVIALLGRFFRKIVVVAVVAVQLFMLVWVYTNTDPAVYMKKSGYTTNLVNVDVARGGNIINRVFYLWPRAAYLYLQSPIVGMGYGSYNDVPYRIEEVAPLVKRNANDFRGYDSAHAHHTYLHIMAENGTIGIVLFFLCLWGLDKTIRNLPFAEAGLALRLALWTAIFTSLTEHRFFTPSQMLPFMLCLGLAIAARNGLAVMQNQENDDNAEISHQD